MSDSFDVQVCELLKRDGATLVRNNGHEIWKLSNGETYTQSGTPSDINASRQRLRTLRAKLGIIDPERGKEGERRERKVRHEAPPVKPRAIGATVNGAFAEKLLASGIVAASHEAEIAELKARIERQREALANLHGDYKANKTLLQKLTANRCWWCRLKKWVARLVAEARALAKKGGAR